MVAEGISFGAEWNRGERQLGTKLAPKAAIEGNNAIVVTWQKSNGDWKACGPVQRLATGWGSEEKAIDLVTGDTPVYFQGNYGKYKIYKTERDLESGDFNARRCIE